MRFIDCADVLRQGQKVLDCLWWKVCRRIERQTLTVTMIIL